MPDFHLVTHILRPPAACFDLSLSIEAHIASTRPSRERAVAGVTSGIMQLGEEVTWEARHLGRMWRLTSRISELERPTYFIDEQVRGPFAFWWHRHDFESVADGTRMTDTVRFAAPMGLLGSAAEAIFLTRYMRTLMVERNKFLKAKLEDLS